uniref:Vacuolar protein sorting-associated protein 28 homolog n=1 Tax=Macrostomum lignano TaxID=282301 RepID=A0A1I8JGE2_9PLAT
MIRQELYEEVKLYRNTREPRYRMNCPAAISRIKEDRPITIKDDKGNTSRCIADIVALYITIMDNLRLNMLSKDQLDPNLRELMETMNRMSMLPTDFEGKAKVKEWLDVLAGLGASDELDEAQARQMVFDMESGYNAFNRILHMGMKTVSRPLLRVKIDELFLRWFTEEATMSVLRENLQQLLEGESLAAMLAVAEPTPTLGPHQHAAGGMLTSPRPQTPPHHHLNTPGGLRSYSPRSPRRQAPIKNGGNGSSSGSGTRFRIRLHPRMGRTSGQFVLTGGDKPVTVQYSVGGPPSVPPQSSPSPTPLSVQTSAGSSVISGGGNSSGDPQSPSFASQFHARLESPMTAPAIASPGAGSSPTTPLSPVRRPEALLSGPGPRLVKDKPLALHDAGTPPEVVRIPLGETTDSTKQAAASETNDTTPTTFPTPIPVLVDAPSAGSSNADAAEGGRLTSDRPDVLKNLPDTVDLSDDDSNAAAAAAAAAASAADTTLTKDDSVTPVKSPTEPKPLEEVAEPLEPSVDKIEHDQPSVKTVDTEDDSGAPAVVSSEIETTGKDDSDAVMDDSGDSTTTKEASNSPQTSATSPTGPSSPTATATPSEDAASTPAGPVVTALLKEADSLRGQDIPRFYFPDTGRVSSAAPAAPVDDSRLVQALDEIQGQTVTLAQMADIAKAMGYPKFWKQPLFSAAGGTEQRPAAKDRLLTLRRELTKNFRDDSSRFVHLLTRGARQHLVSDDFLPLVQDIVDSHPGLSFLQEAPEFHGRYVNTVIARIFYEVNASWTGRITCQELRRSKLLATIASLELKDDINEVTDFFSYEHFYVIYCKFWDIDTDHDLFISKEDLRRHNNYDRIIDRIFSGAVSRNKSLLTESRMSYPDFVWFLLAEEDKRHPRSIEYWFRCMDLDGDGVISLYEMEYFYTEQMRRMEEARIEEYQGLQDCVCTMLDMVKPAQPNRIALGDLKRCKLAGVFFDTMFNLHKFLDYEQRDPFANLRDIQECAGMSDWEKYAAEMYEILVAEESNGAMHDDAAYADDFENMEEDPAENFRSGEGLKFLESFKGSKEI